MTNLATTYCHQGRWNEAEKLEVDVMELSKGSLGAEHHNALISMANLSSIHQQQGKKNKTETLDDNIEQNRSSGKRKWIQRLRQLKL
jgi:Tetratricopeptide repeat